MGRMKISLHVSVKTGAGSERVEELREGALRVFLKQNPEDGKANARLVALLARRYGVPQTAVRIVRGVRERSKIISITI